MRSFISSVVSSILRKSVKVFSGGEESVTNSLRNSRDLTKIVKNRLGTSSQRLDKKNIQRSWAESIISSGVISTSSDNGGIHKNKSVLKLEQQPFLKRTTSDKVGKLTSQINFAQKSKIYRRRLTDMSWTVEPMDDKLIWVDCEMTGLKLENGDMIMEIGCIITEPNLEEIAHQPSITIHIPEEKLQGMDPWCVQHHGDSGLTELCRQSKLTSEEVDEQLLNFVQKYTTKAECPMAGNTISMDRLFIAKQFPRFHEHFHYRNVDVSTLKELCRRWYPEEYSKAPKKKYSHRVIDDIKDSIAELEYYKNSVMKKTTIISGGSKIEKKNSN